MTYTASPASLTPTGYLILRGPDEAVEHDAQFPKLQRYCGVDRQPTFIAPDPTTRKLVREAPVEDQRLYDALDQWFEFRGGPTAFIPSRIQATRLWTAFQDFGFRLELIFCELAWQEGDRHRLSAYVPLRETRPHISLTYGFDVSWPSCNHSAILQPGVVRSSTVWRAKLNDSGLLENYLDAVRLRDEYLNVYPYPPFDIYLVHKIGVETQ